MGTWPIYKKTLLTTDLNKKTLIWQNISSRLNFLPFFFNLYLCPVYQVVDNEIHFVTKCCINENLRTAFWNKIQTINIEFPLLSDENKFCYMMCNGHPRVLSWYGKFVYQSFQIQRKGSLQWRHNDQDGVSNHQRHGCLLNRSFRRRSKKTSKLHVTGLCVGNSPGPVNSPHKGPVTRKMFPFDDVIMLYARVVTRDIPGLLAVRITAHRTALLGERL